MNTRGPVTRTIQTRVSPDTHALASQRASRAGLTRAEYVEQLVLAESARQMVPRARDGEPQRGEVGRPTVALLARVSPDAHAAAKAAAHDCGLSVSLYIERAVLADAEHQLVKSTPAEQQMLEVAV